MRTFPQKVSHFGKIKAIKRAKKNRKLKDLEPILPGQLIETDSIERREFGLKRYIITFVDIYSRFTFAWCYSGHGSNTAKDFLDKLKIIFPFPIQRLQTDQEEYIDYHTDELFNLEKFNANLMNYLV